MDQCRNRIDPEYLPVHLPYIYTYTYMDIYMYIIPTQAICTF